jgi:hypothetical protein
LIWETPKFEKSQGQRADSWRIDLWAVDLPPLQSIVEEVEPHEGVVGARTWGLKQHQAV